MNYRALCGILLLAACAGPSDVSNKAGLITAPSLTISPPTDATAEVISCSGQSIGILISWTTTDPNATATRIEIDTQGTRDRAGHPFNGWYVTRNSSYANVVSPGVYDIYLVSIGNGEQSAETAILGFEATHQNCPKPTH